MTARDQMVGPWQVPVADVAVTTMGYQGYLGEASVSYTHLTLPTSDLV